jgi:hypothetical protein
MPKLSNNHYIVIAPFANSARLPCSFSRICLKQTKKKIMNIEIFFFANSTFFHAEITFFHTGITFFHAGRCSVKKSNSSVKKSNFSVNKSNFKLLFLTLELLFFTLEKKPDLDIPQWRGA